MPETTDPIRDLGQIKTPKVSSTLSEQGVNQAYMNEIQSRVAKIDAATAELERRKTDPNFKVQSGRDAAGKAITQLGEAKKVLNDELALRQKLAAGDPTPEEARANLNTFRKANPTYYTRGKVGDPCFPCVAETVPLVRYGSLPGFGRYVLYPDGTVKVGNQPWRNNNPGNITDKPPRYGAIGHNGTFAIYPDEATGKAALDTKLHQASWQQLSVEDAMNKYAPPNENDTEGYINRLTTDTGVSRDTLLSALTPEQMTAFQNTIMDVEGFNATGQTYNVNDPNAPAPIRALGGGGGG